MSRIRLSVTVLGSAIALVSAGVGAGASSGVTPDAVHRARPAFSQSPPAAARGQATIPDRALIDKYCLGCHNQRLKTGGLALDTIDLAQTHRYSRELEAVVRKLRAGQMPPSGQARPSADAVSAFLASLETSLDKAAAVNRNPGRVGPRRLNRTEYVYAVRDLLDLEIDGQALLPADASAFGFDNNADTLAITPALMSRYMSAATKVSRLAIGDPAIRPVAQVYRVPEFGRQDVRAGDDLPLGTHGGLAIRHAFPLDGQYTIKVRLQRNRVAGTIRGLDSRHDLELRLDRSIVKRFEIGGQFPGIDHGMILQVRDDDPEGQKRHEYRLHADDHLEVQIPVKAGTRLLSVAFAGLPASALEGLPARSSQGLKNQYYTDDRSDPGVDTIEITGPVGASVPTDTPSRRRIFTCRPVGAADEDACARRILTGLARRAYRRPVASADVQPLLNQYKIGRENGSFEGGIGRAIETLLTLPGFLFRIESDPVAARPAASYRVTDVELASRLSFFLWRSIPDDELLGLAVDGKLKDPAILERQVRRMLADPRASRWMSDFVGQWLVIRNAVASEPDPVRYPDFEETLRDAMLRETQLFFESQVREDRGVLDLFSADYTFLNARLAEHYGIPNVYGSQFRKVVVPDEARRGLLGHGSILMVTSYPDRTSVVLRGKWVLENLLGAPPPPPPPNVPPLKSNDGKSKPTALRERMEEHRRNPVCASCHSAMDPYGFVLENFDAIGKWRTTDEGAPIDATTALPDGTKLGGPAALRQALLETNRDAVIRTLTEKLLTFALGRGVEYYDAPVVRQLMRDAARSEYRWSSLILGIVKSQAFQMRRASATETPVVARRAD